jgi:lipid-A-disaccharide synthase
MPEVMIVAGEVSGDTHAGNMLEELQRLAPDLRAFGVGGERLSEAGLELVASTDELAHMGLVEVVRELPRIRRLFNMLVEQARRRRPAVAVLVDSPDFNLRLAKRLTALGTRVVLYVSPQLWAWRRGRVRTVARVAREVLCLLPFEAEFYAGHGVGARYVGHPLIDDIERSGLLEHGLPAISGRLALLPGSRVMEVRQLLPVMLQTLRTLPEELVREAVLVEAPGVRSAVDSILAAAPAEGRLRRATGPSRRRELARAEVAWTASGTATLECALLDVPMIVGYRLQAISFLLAKALVRVPHVALVNLIAGRRVVPELLQDEFDPRRLADETTRVLSGDSQRQRTELALVRQLLGGPGASLNAARAVAEHLAAARIV